MIPPNNCPYKSLTAPPCWNCKNHDADIDNCLLNNFASRFETSDATKQSWQNTLNGSKVSYQDRVRIYEDERAKLLQLSKEDLVDLIINPPTLY